MGTGDPAADPADPSDNALTSPERPAERAEAELDAAAILGP